MSILMQFKKWHEKYAGILCVDTETIVKWLKVPH